MWILVFHSYSFSLTKTITVQFCYLIFITSDFYLINNLVVPQFLLKRKYVLFVFALIITIASSAWLRALVAAQMNLLYFKTSPIADFTTLYLNSVVNISLWVLLITLDKMLIDRMRTQQKLEFLEKERIKNELNY